jgi:hypothetical protein
MTIAAGTRLGAHKIVALVGSGRLIPDYRTCLFLVPHLSGLPDMFVLVPRCPVTALTRHGPLAGGKPLGCRETHS